MQAATRRQHSHQRKDQHRDSLGVDAGEFGGFRIAADGVDVAAKPRPPGEERHDEAGDQRDQHRNRVAGRNVQAAFRHRDIVVGGVFRRDTLGPGIGVDDRSRAKDDKAADDRDHIFGPHRPLRKTKSRPPLTAGIEAEDDAGASERSQRPARRRPDRAVRAPAHQREAVVERCDRLAGRHPPSRAAPEQLPAEGDDEGGNAEIGDERTVKGANRRADRQSNHDGDHPDRRIVEAEIDRQNMDLRDADDGRDEADDRSDRKVDMAHHDDEHHARRHDGDRGRLDAQIPKVARREEEALAGLDQRIDVEPDPDQRQRADHADHAGVDLGGPEQPPNGGLVRSRAGRARRCRGHAPSRSSALRRRNVSGRRAIEKPRRLANGAAIFCFTPLEYGQLTCRRRPIRASRRRRPRPW